MYKSGIWCRGLDYMYIFWDQWHLNVTYNLLLKSKDIRLDGIIKNKYGYRRKFLHL
jgi:hypothetical protein